jgi:histone-binding protein RBBP4
MLASGAEDGKVYVWDNSKCGEEQARNDYEDGPPELAFHHEHHSSLIEDIRWLDCATGNATPMIASVEN